MLGLVSKGMDLACLLRSSDETPPRFKGFRNVPRIRIVDHLSREPTTSYPWDPKNRVAV